MNKRLPVYKHANEIVNAVDSNPVIIIKAETGSGKSTQIPQILYENGYEVVVTQPRRVAARSVAARVADEMGCKLGGLVGFRTGFERLDSEETKILFCTDGLELSRELMNTMDNKKRVLCIDEVHEWNLNIEALVAWCKLKIKEGFASKLVIMSATLDTTKLQEYFYDCPVFEIPGTLFPVEVKEASKADIKNEIRKLTIEGKNILVFLPGKGEINDFISELRLTQVDAEIVPLHGELSNKEQDLCFKKYNRSKIVVATNIAQTSITIPDIDVVVDFGTEKRIEVYNGVEGLYERNISQSDCLQRKGRAGRVKNGIYYLVSEKTLDMREKFSTPEIQRLRLDSVVLKFLSIGIELEDLELFHEVSYTKIRESKKLLESLGAIEGGKITWIGKKMARMPLQVQLSRMLIEAEERGVLKDAITVAAIIEVGYFLKKGEYVPVKNKDSDILNLMLIFKMLEEEYFKTHNYSSPLFDKVNKKAYFRIVEIRKKLFEYYNREGVKLTTTSNLKNVVMSFLVAYKKEIYARSYWGYTKNRYSSESRRCDKNSVCSSNILVGIPKDIIIKKGYSRTISLLTMCSEISLEMVEEVIPEIVTSEIYDYVYDKEEDIVKVVIEKSIGEIPVLRKNVPITNREKAREYIIKFLAKQTISRYDNYFDGPIAEICDNNRFWGYPEAISFYDREIGDITNIAELLANKEMLENIKQYPTVETAC